MIRVAEILNSGKVSPPVLSPDWKGIEPRDMAE